MEKDEDVLRAIEEYAVECSILKVMGREYLDYAVDEGVQMLGGAGFSADYAMERHHRNSRIFEGTNEINRLLIPGMLLKRATKGQIPLLNEARKLLGEMLDPMPPQEETGVLLEAETKGVAAAKKVCLLTLGAAAEKFGQDIVDQQEVLVCASNMVMDTYVMESALLRVQKKIEAEGEGKTGLVRDITRTFVGDALGRIELEARHALAAVAEGDPLRTLLSAVRKLLRHIPHNSIPARRRIAGSAIEAEAYPLG